MPRAELILVNLGTPETPTVPAVRRFLAEFLSDPMVVEKPRWLWLPILHLLVLPRRPAVVVKGYAEIWEPTGAAGNSPLALGTRALAAAVGERARSEEAGTQLGPVEVTYAYRYGEPSLATRLRESMRRHPGAEHPIHVITLFPQRTASSSGTAEALTEQLAQQLGLQSRLRITRIPPTAPGYIEAQADSIRATACPEPAHLLITFHGIPEYVNKAENARYTTDCEATFQALLLQLGWRDGAAPSGYTGASLAFQSLFGRDPWTKPATIDRLIELGAAGESIVMAAPGFLTATLETIEELGIRGKEAFLEAGGKHFALAPTVVAHQPGGSPVPAEKLVQELLSLTRD